MTEELVTHFGPMAATVDRLDKTVRSLYSNGSGGPPGYLETARAEDNLRYTRLLTKVDELCVDQKAANLFIVLAGAEAKRKEKRREFLAKVGWKFAALSMAALLGLAGWTYKEVSPLVRSVVKEYLRSHPAVSEELKNHVSMTPVCALATGQGVAQAAGLVADMQAGQ